MQCTMLCISVYVCRKSVVYLHCDYGSDPTIIADGDEETMLTYIFHLYTNEVCFGNGGVSSGYIGLILILLLVVNQTSLTLMFVLTFTELLLLW